MESSKLRHHLSRNLRKVCSECGLTSQTKIADALGVSQPTVSQWERGQLLPDFPDLVRLEELCGPGTIARLFDLPVRTSSLPEDESQVLAIYRLARDEAALTPYEACRRLMAPSIVTGLGTVSGPMPDVPESQNEPAAKAKRPPTS